MSSNVPFTEFLAQYGQFNCAIRSHVAIADARPEVRAALTETTRIAFLEIISRANIENSLQPIWIRVDRTAERISISTKSVSRTIKMMKKKGWIVPSKTHDGRNNNGEFDGREYLLTPSMRRLMSLQENSLQKETTGINGMDEGMVAPPAAPPSSAAVNTKPAEQLPIVQVAPPAPARVASLPPGSNLSRALAIVQRRAIEEKGKNAISDAQAVPVVTDEAVENPVDNAVLPADEHGQKAEERTDLSHGVIYAVNKVFSLKEASLHKRGLFLNTETGKTIRLPLDLLPLVEELQIKPEGVCKLMRIAGLKGHRLQDVWAVKRELFLSSGAREGRAVRYFEFLLNCGEDFAYRATIKVSASNPASPGTNRPAAPSPTRTPAPSVSPSVSAEQAPNSELGKLTAIAKAARFKRFRHVTNGMVVRFFDGAAEVTRGLERVMVGGWRDLENFYVGISRGNLVPVME
jgi:hypothetical protein